MLRLWNFYRDEYIKQESPLCSICNNLVIGDFYDRDWQQIRLCRDCYDVLTKRSATNRDSQPRCEGRITLSKGK